MRSAIRWGLLILAGCHGATLEGTISSSTQLEADAGASGGPAADAGSATSMDAGAVGGPDAGAVGVPDAGSVASGPVCGDGRCEAPEACHSCEADCGACAWPAELVASEDALLVLVNALRASGTTCGGQSMPSVGPLVMQENLRDAARLHSQDMGERGYFDHTSLDGRSPWQRMADAGYRGQGVGENIAAGNGGADATFRQWHTSAGHCRNMMSGQAREIGVGHAYVAGSRYGHYWTQAFGR